MKKIIGIDFDGTCVTDLYPYVGDNIGAASVLRELGDKNLLILYTVRDGKYLQDAVDWFRYNHINLYSVNYNPEPVSSSPKLYCDYYIDDRNIGTPLTDKGYVDWNKLYSASGVLTVMMHGDREDNPIPEMLPNAGTNPDNIITTISGIGNDGGDW